VTEHSLHTGGVTGSIPVAPTRKRQSVVSLLGIVLGVAFFLSIFSMMQGSENDFMKRLVNNSPAYHDSR